MTLMDYMRELAHRLQQLFTKYRRSMLARLIAALFKRLAGNTR